MPCSAARWRPGRLGQMGPNEHLRGLAGLPLNFFDVFYWLRRTRLCIKERTVQRLNLPFWFSYSRRSRRDTGSKRRQRQLEVLRSHITLQGRGFARWPTPEPVDLTVVPVDFAFRAAYLLESTHLGMKKFSRIPCVEPLSRHRFVASNLTDRELSPL